MASFYDRSFLDHAKLEPPPVRFESLFHADMAQRSIGDVISNAEQLRLNLLIRLARRIVDIHRLPFGAATQPPMQKLHDLFVQTFHAFLRTPEPRTELLEGRFALLLEDLLGKTKQVLPLLLESHVVLAAQMPQPAVNTLLNTMIVSRISRRILAAHHLALRRHVLGDGEGTTFGTIQRDCDLALLADHAYHTATAGLARAPQLVASIPPRNGPLCYVPSHLHLILRELFAWTATAVTRRHGTHGHTDTPLPPIEMTVFEAADRITIRIVDQGGGVSEEELATLFDYQARPTGWAHLGLPLARAYAGYFGGMCRVQSLPDHGCEIFLTIRHLTASCLGVLNSDTYVG